MIQMPEIATPQQVAEYLQISTLSARFVLGGCRSTNIYSYMVSMKRVKMLSDSDIIASGDQYYDHREFTWKPIDSYTIGTPKIKWFQFYVVVRG